ncbi:hypothetical protein AB0M92_11375 [Streptomyces sp. NPDC051582]
MTAVFRQYAREMRQDFDHFAISMARSQTATDAAPAPSRAG